MPTSSTDRGRKRYGSLKRLRENNPTHEKVIKARKLNNRRNRKYERKKSWMRDPARALKRFQKLAIQIRNNCIAMYSRSVFDSGDLDYLKRYFEGLSNEKATHADWIIEFMELMMTYKFIFPSHDGEEETEESSQMVTIILNQTVTDVEVMHYNYLNAYSKHVILVHDGKLYHNSPINVYAPNDFEFEIVRIRRSDPSKYHKTNLESYLLEYKGITISIENLKQALKDSVQQVV